MTVFTGSATALITPFTDSGINYSEYDRLLERQLSGGTAALVVCGTTGEPSTMSSEERLSLISHTVRSINGKIPVIAGAGSNSTQSSVDACKAAQDAGADAVLVVTPYYNKTTQDGLVRHYETIASAISIPLIIYNVPSRTGLDMKPETIARLYGCPNIAAVKAASGNVQDFMDIVRLCGDKIDLISGDDLLVLPCMAAGGKGVISVASNVVPDVMSSMVNAYLQGDIAGCRELQYRYMEFIKLLFCEVNPIPAKAALAMMGYDTSILRAPLYPLSSANEEKLRRCMQQLGIL